MRVVIKAIAAGTVADLDERKDLTLLDGSTDVEYVKEHFGNRPAVQDFDGFFVQIINGEFGEVYGFKGNIASLGKPVYKITRTYYEESSKPRKRKKRKSPKRVAVSVGLRGVR